LFYENIMNTNYYRVNHRKCSNKDHKKPDYQQA